ncbi:Type I secretion outer membrane protein, TolC family [hydrothermal vent metagenome]|uniref:Type I secretion outer membrane protein, TolC family n=1 Tax=hydrothermal vent metagenome TaxID=652676 RepID=A0A3B0T288_9ZZZZ
MVVVPAASPAVADTLRDALAQAYANNPELGAERAQLRATDEGVPQALSGYRPNISAALDYGGKRSNSITFQGPVRLKSSTYTHPRGYSVSITQNVFDGFRTRNRTAQAEANVQAGRGILLNTEQNVLLSAATAFLDVRRDMAIVRLRTSNVEVLREEVKSTRARFDVGELTRTDVAQADARVSRAISELSAGRADLATSRAVYEQIVGRAPGRLAAPPNMVSRLPRSVQSAYQIAQDDHPAIRSALFTVEAGDRNVDAITGEFLPTVSVEGTYSDRWEAAGPESSSDATTIMGRLTIPIYQAGAVSSRLRAAKQTNTQRRLEVENIRNQVRASVSSAWAGLKATRAQIVADNQQVRAAGVALDGVRQEASVGQRTTLDVLDAQQEALNAQVTLEITRRNEQVATFNLLAAIGQLNADAMGLAVARYDPAVNYDNVRGKWFGIDVDTVE